MSTAPTIETISQPESLPELTAHDRCDRCGAQAFIRWSNGPLDLLTCSHHGNRYEPDLIAQGFDLVQDTRHKLNPKPSPSANV